MGFLKKQSAGFFITGLSAIVMIVGIVFYFINCNTKYFSNLGINMLVVICGIVAILGQVIYLFLCEKEMESIATVLFPIASSVLMMLAAVTFIGSRVYGMASIMTFENNASNMADLTNAMIGMALCLIAVILAMLSSFFCVRKDIAS